MDQPQPTYYDDDLDIDLRRYATLIWQHMWLLILGVVLAAGAAFAVSKLETPVYQASTTLFINQAPNTSTSDYNAVLTSERLAQTYSQMVTQRPILEATLEQTGETMPVEDFQKMVDVQLLPNTQLIVIKVENTSPGTAARLANTLATVFQANNDQLQTSRYTASKDSLQKQMDSLQADIQATQTHLDQIGTPLTDSDRAEVDRLQTNLTQLKASYANVLQSYEQLRLAEAQSVSNVTQTEPATPPLDPIRPRTLLNTLLAAVVGGMLALGVVFLIDYLDDTVKSPDQVARELGLPVLGTIAEIPNNHAEQHVHVAENPRSPVAEAFRALRTNIQFAGVDTPIRSLLITSPGPEVGKSTVTTNLGAVMAHGGRKTLIVEADLRRPRIHKLLGITRQRGLSDLFVEKKLKPEDVLQATSVDGLSAISSGSLPPNPAELLASARMSQILEAALAHHDIVLLDSSPAAVVTDPVVLSEKVDAVLLVIEPGKTELDAALQAVTALRRAGANLIGVVFNNVSLDRAGYYGGYRYQYKYSYAGEEEQPSDDSVMPAAGSQQPTADSQQLRAES